MNTLVENARRILVRYTPNNSSVNEAESAIATLVAEASVDNAINELLGLFERFPEEYGDVVFWSAMHQLEVLPNYEFYLLTSVKNAPSCFGLLMINRLLNVKQLHIGQMSLLELLEQVSIDNQASKEVRIEAAEFLQYQISKQDKGT